VHNCSIYVKGPSWSWSYGSWIYNYLCNQCLSPLTLLVRTPFRRGVIDTTLCDKVCQWFATGRWISPDTPVSSTNKIESIPIHIFHLFGKHTHSYIPSVWKAYPFIYSIRLESIPIHIFHPFGKHTHSYIPSVWKAYPFIYFQLLVTHSYIGLKSKINTHR
jgi:hypothetical protein